MRKALIRFYLLLIITLATQSICFANNEKKTQDAPYLLGFSGYIDPIYPASIIAADLSVDGKSWSPYKMSDKDISARIPAVAWGNGRYVALINNGGTSVITSQDGINWTSPVKISSSIFDNMIWGNNEFIAINNSDGFAITSPDGVTWNRIFSPAEYAHYTQIIWAKNQYMLVGTLFDNSYYVVTGPDSAHLPWTEQRSKIPGDLKGVAWGNDTYVIVGSYYNPPVGRENLILTSHDGVNWTQVSVPRTQTFYDQFVNVAWGNNKFIIAAQTYYYVSTDGLNWTRYDNPGFEKIYWLKNQFIGIGRNYSGAGAVLTSPDGMNWTRSDTNTSYMFSAITG